MAESLLDLSYLYQISDNDQNYINDIITLFLNTIPAGLANLQKMAAQTDDYNYDAVRKQAHFLKSSAHIVKVSDMYECLMKIEALAKQETGKEEIVHLLQHMVTDFEETLPYIKAEKNRTKAKKRK